MCLAMYQKPVLCAYSNSGASTQLCSLSGCGATKQMPSVLCVCCRLWVNSPRVKGGLTLCQILYTPGGPDMCVADCCACDHAQEGPKGVV